MKAATLFFYILATTANAATEKDADPKDIFAWLEQKSSAWAKTERITQQEMKAYGQVIKTPEVSMITESTVKKGSVPCTLLISYKIGLPEDEKSPVIQAGVRINSFVTVPLKSVALPFKFMDVEEGMKLVMSHFPEAKGAMQVPPQYNAIETVRYTGSPWSFVIETKDGQEKMHAEADIDMSFIENKGIKDRQMRQTDIAQLSFDSKAHAEEFADVLKTLVLSCQE